MTIYAIKKTNRTVAVLFMCGLMAFGIASALPAAGAMTVAVSKQGDHIGIDVDFVVAVSQQQAWEVLTDFDHMRDFISSLQSSRVIERRGTRWQVTQSGAAQRGPLSFNFDSVREIELAPFDRITSRQLSGSMKKFEAVTQVSAVGDGTRIQYHADSIPGTFIPPVVGPAFIETESRHQFEEMRTEMLRRSVIGNK